MKNESGNLESLESSISSLAIDLATNYCTVSFGEREKQKISLKDIFEKTFMDNLLDQEALNNSGVKKQKSKTKPEELFVDDLIQHRNVLIIGAGSTYDSYKCIPLGKEVIEKFEEKYRSKIDAFPSVRERYENYKKDLLLQNGKLDFENMLALYSQLILTPDELRSEISNFFNFRYCPSLFYEIIAHLFKHSFIDVIINFNFDEILDQAIEEELGRDNYYHIISDGDCVHVDNMMVDGRLKIPIYIKPHGTVSHRSTLRFTKRHYLDVPEQIKNIIIDLIKGKRGEIRGAQTENISQINIISAGFNFESLEFRDILNENLPNQSKIYHLCFEKEDARCKPSFIKNLFPDFYDRAYSHHILNEGKPWDFSKLEGHIYKRIPVEHFNLLKDKKNELTTPFAEIFSAVWREIYYSLSKNFLPRSIARHEIISYFFYDPQFSSSNKYHKTSVSRQDLTEKYEEGIGYFLDRTIVEIAMAINRNNGIIEIAQILGDRVGIYYKKYRDRYYQIHKTNRGALSIYDLLHEFQQERLVKNMEGTYTTNVFKLDLSALPFLKKDKLLSHLRINPTSKGHTLKEKMQRWEIKDLVVDEAGNLEEDDNGNPIIGNDRIVVDSILKNFDTILHQDPPFNEISIMVLYRLFEIKYLSQSFLINFKTNYNKIIYNAKDYPDTSIDNKNRLLDEIGRLFLKSGRQHYYSIRPKYHDPKNFISESFSKTRLLHTNLAIEYTFRNMFLNTDWDIALIISETGSMLNFLQNEPNLEKFLSGKKIIVLTAFEAIKQYHLKKLNIRKINDKHNAEYVGLLGIDANWGANLFYTFSLPSVRHNHHMMLFIKKIEANEHITKYDVRYSNEDRIEKNFKMSASMYMYRQGFSNNLNPLFIGMSPYTSGENILALKHDFIKLLRIFTITFCRSLVFEGTKKVSNLDLELDTARWTAKREQENVSKLLAYLYDLKSAVFLRS